MIQQQYNICDWMTDSVFKTAPVSFQNDPSHGPVDFKIILKLTLHYLVVCTISVQLIQDVISVI